MGKKIRIDLRLVEEGYFDSREKARRSIMAGVVLVDQQVIDKPGTKVDDELPIKIKGNPIPYVSRGGLKLQKAMEEFNLNLQEKVCMDVGASTGGFTDCMLQKGAKKVYAIDVGYGQLDWKLRQDERVISMERTNIRYVMPTDLDEAPNFSSVDVSFISLKLVLPVIKNLLSFGGEIVALIKPQFEAGREKVGKKGVVRDIQVHEEVVMEIYDFAEVHGLYTHGFSYSPIKGPEGNIEYLIYLKTNSEGSAIGKEQIKVIVQASHVQL